MKKKVVNPLLPGRYGRMSAAELDREVAIFDQEFIADTARPLSAADRARLKRARGKGAHLREKKRVVVSLDSGLVRRTDAFAKKRGITRADLIAQALRTVLGRTGKPMKVQLAKRKRSSKLPPKATKGELAYIRDMEKRSVFEMLETGEAQIVKP